MANSETNKVVDQDTTIQRIIPDPIYSNRKKQVTKFLKREVTENLSLEIEVANRYVQNILVKS